MLFRLMWHAPAWVLRPHRRSKFTTNRAKGVATPLRRAKSLMPVARSENAFRPADPNVMALVAIQSAKNGNRKESNGMGFKFSSRSLNIPRSALNPVK